MSIQQTIHEAGFEALSFATGLMVWVRPADGGEAIRLASNACDPKADPEAVIWSVRREYENPTERGGHDSITVGPMTLTAALAAADGLPSVVQGHAIWGTTVEEAISRVPVPTGALATTLDALREILRGSHAKGYWIDDEGTILPGGLDENGDQGQAPAGYHDASDPSTENELGKGEVGALILGNGLLSATWVYYTENDMSQSDWLEEVVGICRKAIKATTGRGT